MYVLELLEWDWVVPQHRDRLTFCNASVGCVTFNGMF